MMNDDFFAVDALAKNMVGTPVLVLLDCHS